VHYIPRVSSCIINGGVELCGSSASRARAHALALIASSESQRQQRNHGATDWAVDGICHGNAGRRSQTHGAGRGDDRVGSGCQSSTSFVKSRLLRCRIFASMQSHSRCSTREPLSGVDRAAVHFQHFRRTHRHLGDSETRARHARGGKTHFHRGARVQQNALSEDTRCGYLWALVNNLCVVESYENSRAAWRPQARAWRGASRYWRQLSSGSPR